MELGVYFSLRAVQKQNKDLVMKQLISVVMGFAFLSGCTAHQFHDETAGKIDTVEVLSKSMRQHFPVYEPAFIEIERPPISLESIGNTSDPQWYGTWVKKKVVDNLPFGIAVRNAFEGYGLIVSIDHDLDQQKMISLAFTGTLREMLDEFSLASGYAYTIDDNRINWHYLMTKTFDVAAMPGVNSHSLGTGSEDTEEEGIEDQAENQVRVSSTEYSSNVAELNVWKDLSNVITALLSEDKGKFFVSETSTTITVRDYPANVRAIESVIKDFNRRMSAQVLVVAKIVNVRLNESRSDGINWTVVKNTSSSLLKFAAATATTGLSTSTVPATFSVSKTAGSLDGSNVLVSALGEQGKTSVLTAPRQLTLNNQVAELLINTDTAYLASSSSLISDTTTETTLEPGVVTEGFTLYVLPKIDLDNEQVFLQFSTSLNDLQKINTVTSGTASIQTPVLDKVRINNRVRLKSGETLLLSGFLQNTNTSKGSENFGNGALGFRESEGSRIETLVLITATIVN